MDSVRFGRALGIGARLAAKTMVEAVDAAASPSPTAATDAQRAAPRRDAARPHVQELPLLDGDLPVHDTVREHVEPVAAKRSLRRGGRRFGEAVWAPLARLSGVLWLEVTGVFFGLFALSSAVGAWRLRGEWHRSAANATGHSHLLMTLAVAVVFGYFCASSFVRARQRGRRT